MALPYLPVSCEVYEILEDRAIRRRQCEIVYCDVAGQTVKIRDRIVSLSIQDKVEYLYLESGVCLRLDALIGFDGMQLPPNSYHQQDSSGAIKHE